MRVVIRARARRDLDDILDHSVSLHGEAAAESYLAMIGAAFKRLADYPAFGVPRDELSPGLRCLSAGGHRIFYRVSGGRTSIVRVLHKAMDPSRHL